MPYGLGHVAQLRLDNPANAPTATVKLNENKSEQLAEGNEGNVVWKLNVRGKRLLPSIEIWLRKSGKACKTSHGTGRSNVMFQAPYLCKLPPCRGPCITESTNLLALQMSTWLEQLKTKMSAAKSYTLFAEVRSSLSSLAH